jgi:hypothetical protein
VKGIKYFIVNVYWFLLLLTLFSCEKRDKKPEDILSRDEMVRIMAETYIAEEKVSTLGLSQDSAHKVFNALQSRVFDSTRTTDTVFKKSLDYYMEHPKELEMIYSVLVDTLQLREQRASSLPEQ